MSQSQSPRFNVSSLLSDPGGFAARLRDSERFALPAVFLALVSLVGAAVFGFAVGSFVDLQVAFADSAKMVGVVAFSFALTYPTMYVFASISGSMLSPARLLGLGLVATATLGCILAALARASQSGVVASTAGLSAWFVVFVVVALQTVTLVRPMLAPLGSSRDPSGKCFFLGHFARVVTNE